MIGGGLGMPGFAGLREETDWQETDVTEEVTGCGCVGDCS